MILDITRISDWFTEKIRPWISLILEENPQILYLIAILTALIGVLLCIRGKKRKKKRAEKGGFRNFRGDIWYPDGRIWHEESKTWEEPDYPKK